jgi:glycosyltransferase 2 family protein
MATLLTPKVLRRGLQVFALVSILGVLALLTYTGAWKATLEAFTHVRPGWLLLTLVVASSDWIGGGIRLTLLTRHVHPGARFWPLVLASGLTAWGGYVTPSGAGGGPMQIYGMKRAGVPVPIAMIAAFVSFFTTVVFFALAGPTALLLGAGRSLRAHGLILNISLYDVFTASAAMFGVIGAVMLFVILFPAAAKGLIHGIVKWLARHHSERLARRLESVGTAMDQMHGALVAYFRGSGIVATLVGVVTSPLAHANRLLAGYVAMRAIGIEAHFMDVLMVQVVIAFLLYFAPTPGGAGAAEALSAALMQIYVPTALLPAYTIIWRFTASYATVIVGSYVFYRMLHGRLDEAEVRAAAEPQPA